MEIRIQADDSLNRLIGQLDLMLKNQVMVGQRIVPIADYLETLEDCVAYTVEGIGPDDEVGSSDVSCWVKEFLKALKVDEDAMSVEDWRLTRLYYNNELNRQLNERND